MKNREPGKRWEVTIGQASVVHVHYETATAEVIEYGFKGLARELREVADQLQRSRCATNIKRREFSPRHPRTATPSILSNRTVGRRFAPEGISQGLFLILARPAKRAIENSIG
jgi:hypothetical protein